MDGEQYAASGAFSRRAVPKTLSIGSLIAIAGCSSDSNTLPTTVTEMTPNSTQQSAIATESVGLTTNSQITTASASQSLPSEQSTSVQTDGPRQYNPLLYILEHQVKLSLLWPIVLRRLLLL